jgi:hypothetical protein
MGDSPTEWGWPASATCRPNGLVSARCLDWPRWPWPLSNVATQQQLLTSKFPTQLSREFLAPSREFCWRSREFAGQYFSQRSGACDGENIPKIPDAIANFEEMTVNDKRWRRIEGTYCQEPSPDVRDAALLHAPGAAHIGF